MKRLLVLASGIALMAANLPALAGAGEDLIAKEKCNKCHTDKDTKKGPAFATVAAKYKGKADAPDKLVAMLKTGGKDDHNKVAASDADLKAIVAVVLAK